MSEHHPLMDELFDRAVASLDGPHPVDHASLLRGAHLGFTPSAARRILNDHASLVFLNRLWDAERVVGSPVGPVRVPERIRQLAERPDELGTIHRRLLEATGMRFPTADAEIDLHLMLWALTPATRSTPGTQSNLAQASSLVNLDIRLEDGHLSVGVDSALSGPFEITLHWPDGHTLMFCTPDTRPGEDVCCSAPCPTGELPTSVTIHSIEQEGRS